MRGWAPSILPRSDITKDGHIKNDLSQDLKDQELSRVRIHSCSSVLRPSNAYVHSGVDDIHSILNPLISSEYMIFIQVSPLIMPSITANTRVLVTLTLRVIYPHCQPRLVPQCNKTMKDR